MKDLDTSNAGNNSQRLTEDLKNTAKDKGRESTTDDQGPSLALEEILETIGTPGKFELFQICLCLTAILCPTTFPLFNFVFIGYDTPHTCSHLTNETEVLHQAGLHNDTTASLQYHQCSIHITSNQSGKTEIVTSLPCLNGNDYGGMGQISFVSDWDLVCERKSGLTALVQTMIAAGQAVGALSTAGIADKIGRKPMIIISQVIMGTVGVVAAYAPDIYVLLAMRFLIGFSQQGTQIVTWALVLEGVVPKYRRYLAALSGLCFNISYCLLALCAWLMRDMSWRNIELLTALVNINVLLFPMFLTESPRWLMANKKYDKMCSIFKRACRCNGKDFNDIRTIFVDRFSKFENANMLNVPTDDKLKNILPSSEKKQSTNIVTKYSVIDIFRHKVLLKPTMIILVPWINCSLLLYALVLSSSSLAGDRHLNFFLLGVTDFVGDVLLFLYVDKLGRRVLCAIALTITSICLMTSSILMSFGGGYDLASIFSTIFYMFAKLGTTLLFNVIFVYTPELYPTNIRSAGIGLCSTLSRVGSMAAPYTKHLAELVSWGPAVLFTSICLLSGLMLFLLPETKARSMPATIEEMERWASRKKRKAPTERYDLSVSGGRSRVSSELFSGVGVGSMDLESEESRSQKRLSDPRSGMTWGPSTGISWVATPGLSYENIQIMYKTQY